MLDTFDEGPLIMLVNIANMMHRHIVLPVFICPQPSPPERKCNLCGHNPIQCHHEVMKRAQLPWKEHVFFHNKHVPEIVKKDYMDAPVLMIMLEQYNCPKDTTSNGSGVKCLVAKRPFSEASILELLTRYRHDRVIRLHSIPISYQYLIV